MRSANMIIAGSCGLLLTLSSLAPAGVVLAEELSAPPVEVLQREVSSLQLEEGKTYTLQELLDRTSLSTYEKEQLAQQIIADVQREILEEQSQSMFRALVTYVYNHLNPAEVREAADLYEVTGTLAPLIRRFGGAIGAFYTLTAMEYRYAADRGWGIDFLITLDPYNPTSTGMDFSFRYSH